MIVVIMIPNFDLNGLLPKGIHLAVWTELNIRFGINPHRQKLLGGLGKANGVLKLAGCRLIYIDGSFVTAKVHPTDYDACWDITGVDPYLLDPLFVNFDTLSRARLKSKYMGDLFPAQIPEGASGKAFLDFFQIDKTTGLEKGIVALKL
jgi:hypothetical protein